MPWTPIQQKALVWMGVQLYVSKDEAVNLVQEVSSDASLKESLPIKRAEISTTDSLNGWVFIVADEVEANHPMLQGIIKAVGAQSQHHILIPTPNMQQPENAVIVGQAALSFFPDLQLKLNQQGCINQPYPFVVIPSLEEMSADTGLKKGAWERLKWMKLQLNV